MTYNQCILVSGMISHALTVQDIIGEDKQLRFDIDKSVRDILVPKLLKWNVTANELRQKLGAELARMIELKITFTNSSGTTDIIKNASSYTIAITEELFCYSLSYVANFTDPDDALKFSISRASYPQLIPDWTTAYIVTSDYVFEPENIHFILLMFSQTVHEFGYHQMFYGCEDNVLISVDGLYSRRPVAKGVTYCTLNTTQMYCRAQCRIELIEKVCNCSPTYWAMMIRPTSGLDECTFDRYMECLDFNAGDDLDCKDSCLPSCTATYFRSDSTSNSLTQEYSDTAAAIFSVKDGIYTSIEENPIFTFSDLLITV